jgi:adenylate cyclase
MYFQPPFFKEWIIKMEDDTYDRQVKRYHRHLPEHPSIAIVDIDDRSLAEEGRWPWDRGKMARLAKELKRLGASVVAFDMVFSELQENPVDAVLKSVKNPSLAQELEQLKPSLDSNTVFANELKQGTNILGFAFASNGKETGVLPEPVLTLSDDQIKETVIPHMNGYIGNQPVFQEAADHGGFINAMVDADGIMRFSPLLMRDKDKVYPALALEAAKLFLGLKFSGIVASRSGEHQVVRAIQLGEISIPTDPWGRILVPFRGPPYSFPYISATDVLHGKVAGEQISGKLIFIGVSATASSDLIATAISPVFPGTEVQASIASGIIDRYLPYKPNWGRGGAVAMVLILGVAASFTFPYMSRIAAILASFLVIIILELVNYWIWTRHSIVLSFFFPVPTLATIFIFDLITAYISDRRQNKEIKRIFGTHVSSHYLENMLQKTGAFTLAGEHKELTIISADIWNFSSLTSQFSTAEMKSFLNRYFTEMNQIVFEQKGIIDKYSRDRITAFWGAPLTEPKHAFLAVKAALEMQKKIPELKYPIGIGIETGAVHVGDMGSKYHHAYTAIGNAVDEAFHLKGLTQVYSVGVIVGNETWSTTKEAFIYRKLDCLEGGKEIYEPVCLKGELTPQLAAELEQHHEALQAYLEKNWNKAQQLFGQLENTSAQNKPLYQGYLERIAKNLSNH